MASKSHPETILCRSRCKAQNYYVCNTRGPFHVFRIHEKTKKTFVKIKSNMASKMECLSLLRKSGSRPRKEAPRRPRTPEDAPSTLHDAAKTAPKPPQEGSKMALRWHQDASGHTQYAPRYLQDAPERAQSVPESPPGARKMPFPSISARYWVDFGDNFH